MKVAAPLLASNRVERRYWRLALRASVAQRYCARIERPHPLTKQESPLKGFFMSWRWGESWAEDALVSRAMIPTGYR